MRVDVLSNQNHQIELTVTFAAGFLQGTEVEFVSFPSARFTIQYSHLSIKQGDLLSLGQKLNFVQKCIFPVIYMKLSLHWTVWQLYVWVETHWCHLHQFKQFFLLTQVLICEIFAKNIENWEYLKNSVFLTCPFWTFLLIISKLVTNQWGSMDGTLLCLDDYHNFQKKYGGGV